MSAREGAPVGAPALVPPGAAPPAAVGGSPARLAGARASSRVVWVPPRAAPHDGAVAAHGMAQHVASLAATSGASGPAPRRPHGGAGIGPIASGAHAPIGAASTT